MKQLIILKIIIFIITFITCIYFYLHSRKIGCKDPLAMNYNPEVDIEVNSKCKYHTLGCMDKNAGNYNHYATTSCEEDCIGCELKGTCDLCKYQKKCTDFCPDCICEPKKLGCNRSWALNYDPKATEDNGTCISEEDILKKVSVISGGDCKNCSGVVNIKIGDEYLILDGKQGINVVVLERDVNLKVRHNRGFATGNFDIDNKNFVDFMRQFVFHSDIVILAVRGDAVGKKKEKNSKGEFVYVQSILSDDSKMVIKELGGKVPEIPRNGSYILIGTYMNDIYFETYNAKSDSYFPYFNLTNFGCINFNSEKFEKIQMDLNKFKFLEQIGDSDESMVIQDNAAKDASKYLNMNRVDVINRCALEVISLGYRVFSVSKGNCYIYKLKEGEKLIYRNKEINLSTYFRNKNFIDYTDENKFIKLANYICNLNNQLLPYGNMNEESIYFIDDVYFSGLFSMFYGGQIVEMYNIKNFKGMKTEIGVGIHDVIGSIPKTPDSKQDKISIPVNSIKIPNGFKVTLFRNVFKNEDMSLFKKYRLVVDEHFDNFKMLDLSCCEGASIRMRETSSGKDVNVVEFRIFKNVMKNLEIARGEIKANIYTFDNTIERDTTLPPENDNRYIFKETFNISDYYEIQRLKNFNGVGKIGYIEFFNFLDEQTRKINFDIWENFWPNNFSSVLGQWNAVKNSGSSSLPYLGIFSVSVVDPTKDPLPKTRTLYGYEIESKEVKNGISHKKCNNIPKYGNCDNNDDTAEPYTNDISYVMVSKQDFGITFFEEPEFQGLSITLGYGKFNLPSDLCMLVRSIKVKIKFSIIRLFLDFNFENEYIKIVNKNNKKMNITSGNFTYKDLNSLISENKKIKSIIIEKTNYNSFISNNPYPENYDNNTEYESYSYPIKHELSENKINYLDYCYDYFKDDIELGTNDKFVRIVKEFYKYGFLSEILQSGNLLIINSGGGINYIRQNIGNNIYDSYIKKNLCFLKTYDENDNFIRKIIIYFEKILLEKDDKVILENISELDFSKKERIVKLFYFDNEEIQVYQKQLGFVNIINSMISNFGKYLAVKQNDVIIRMNYDDLDLDAIIDKTINVFAYNNGSENLIAENITNSVNQSEFNFYIVQRSVSTEVPTFCSCSIDMSEYQLNDFIYYKLSRMEGNVLISTVNLAKKVDTLRELSILDDQNNYQILSNIKGSRYNEPLIVQVLNTKFETTKIIFFNGQKYIINDYINDLNIVQNIDKNIIPISKHEKKVDILIRDMVSFNDNYEQNYKKFFNVRKDLNSVLNNYIDSSIEKVNNYLRSSGRIQTRDSKSLIIKDRKFTKNFIESIGNVGNIQELNFSEKEKIITLLDDKNNKIITLPFQIRIVSNSINSLLNYYLQNKDCILKLYDINKNIVRVGLCRNKKYIFKYNGKDLSLDYKIYYQKFNTFNWIDAVNNYTFNLDELYLSIEMDGAEIFYMEINIDNTLKTFDDLLKSFGSNPSLGPVFLFFLKTKMDSVIRFFDKNEKITKKLKFTFNKIIDKSLPTRNAIFLYDSPVQYLETYRNNLLYKFYQKDTLILNIKIPNGMKGVYSYKVDNNIVFVDKVICEDKSNVKLYDENNNLIIESDDNVSHGYLLDIEITNYSGDYILEYYPKIGKTIIRLTKMTEVINKIVTEDLDNTDIDLKDQLGEYIDTIRGKNMYLIENNYYTLKIKNPNGFYTTRNAEKFNNGNF